MADDSVDAVWFARGGYGSNRIAEAAVADLPAAARSKTYLGYSDSGFLLAGLRQGRAGSSARADGAGRCARGGEAAIHRALDWLVRRDPGALEPGLGRASERLAFNLTVLSSLLGTALEPDFSGADLLIEDVAEHEYRIDRTMFHVTGSPAFARAASIRLGRISEIPDNDPAFGSDDEAIVRDWCERSGIAFGGRADIGHDAANRVVPFNICRN